MFLSEPFFSCVFEDILNIHSGKECFPIHIVYMTLFRTRYFNFLFTNQFIDFYVFLHDAYMYVNLFMSS